MTTIHQRSRATTTTTDAPPLTVADLLRRLGRIPADRVRLQPPPGTATEADVLHILDHENIPCELVDGALVEKPMGARESEIAVLIAYFLLSFIRPRRLGIVLGADGTLKVLPNLVRIPDVAFISFDRLPNRRRPNAPIPAIAPDLAVEVLSKGNTRAEINRKLREYFQAGTRLVWLVDPKTKTIRVHTGPTAKQSTMLSEPDTIDGGDVLPGFTLPVRDIFPAAEG